MCAYGFFYVEYFMLMTSSDFKLCTFYWLLNLMWIPLLRLLFLNVLSLAKSNDCTACVCKVRLSCNKEEEFWRKKKYLNFTVKCGIFILSQTDCLNYLFVYENNKKNVKSIKFFLSKKCLLNETLKKPPNHPKWLFFFWLRQTKQYKNSFACIQCDAFTKFLGKNNTREHILK